MSSSFHQKASSIIKAGRLTTNYLLSLNAVCRLATFSPGDFQTLVFHHRRAVVNDILQFFPQFISYVDVIDTMLFS